MIQHATARQRGRMRPFVRAFDTVHPEAALWATRVSANSGTLGTNSLRIASKFMWEVENRSWKDKLMWLLPMLGTNIAAAVVPLRDRVGGGICTNTSFVDADFSESTGLQGNGTNKVLNSNVYPAQLARSIGPGPTTYNGGLGYWELAIDQSGTTSIVMGCYNSGGTERFVLDLRNTGTHEFFGWSGGANMADNAVNATSAFYYGQRSSSTSRVIYRNGSSVATNTTADGPTGLGDTQIRIVGNASPTIGYNKGRCGLALMTDGSLTSAEVLDMYNCLNIYLKTPSGK